MAAFVLVHGGLHGAWCWERVVPLLLLAGHRAEAIDLPGADRRLPADRVTFASYIAATVGAAARAGEPAILVGHSLGGRSISAAAEERPELIRALLYVTALMPSPEHPDALPVEEDNVIASGFYPVDGGASVMLDERPATAGFYSDCSPDDAKAALARIVPQPVAAIHGPVQVTQERWGRVPRYYVFTHEDRTIPIGLQQQMVSNARCTATFDIRCGHSPFYTHPERITEILCEIAAQTDDQDRRSQKTD